MLDDGTDDAVLGFQQPHRMTDNTIVVKEPQLTTHLLSPETYVQPAPPAPDQGKFLQRQDFPYRHSSAKSKTPKFADCDCDAHRQITSLDGGSDVHKIIRPVRRSIDSLVTQSNSLVDPESEDPPVDSRSCRHGISGELTKKIHAPKKFVKVSKRTQEEIRQYERSRNGMDKSLAGEAQTNDWMKMSLDGCKPGPQKPYTCQWTAKRQPLNSMYNRRQTLKTPDEFEQGHTPDEFYGEEDDSSKCSHCHNTFGEEPLRMFVDLKRRIRTCPHFVHRSVVKNFARVKQHAQKTPLHARNATQLSWTLYCSQILSRTQMVGSMRLIPAGVEEYLVQAFLMLSL